MTLRTICGLLVFGALLFPPLSGAIESGPSNTVGFWKLEVYHEFTQVSFPLLPDNKTLNNVLGDQLTGGLNPEDSDQVLRWDPATGQFQMCWYSTTTGNWEGDFSELSEAESYWIYVQSDHPATQTVVTYGNVVEAPSYNMGQIALGYNAVGSVWAVPASISQAGLNGFEGGLYLFLSDLIMSYDAQTGRYFYAWMDDDSLWQGNLTELEPLRGYWIYVAPGHTGFNWSNYPQPNPMGLDAKTPPLDHPANLSTGKRGLRIPFSGLPPDPAKGIYKKDLKTPDQPTSAKGGAR